MNFNNKNSEKTFVQNVTRTHDWVYPGTDNIEFAKINENGKQITVFQFPDDSQIKDIINVLIKQQITGLLNIKDCSHSNGRFEIYTDRTGDTLFKCLDRGLKLSRDVEYKLLKDLCIAIMYLDYHKLQANPPYPKNIITSNYGEDYNLTGIIHGHADVGEQIKALWHIRGLIRDRRTKEGKAILPTYIKTYQDFMVFLEEFYVEKKEIKLEIVNPNTNPVDINNEPTSLSQRMNKESEVARHTMAIKIKPVIDDKINFDDIMFDIETPHWFKK